MSTRDMSVKAFITAAEHHGWEPTGFLGYFRRGNLSVSVLNAGWRRRDQLAYLIAAGEKEDAKTARRADTSLADRAFSRAEDASRLDWLTSGGSEEPR